MNVAVPHDLFAPGLGTAPPHLAGRETELEELRKKMPGTGRKPPSRFVILIGPRGNGKTVLLEAFARQCRKAGADVKRTTPAHLDDKMALVAWLLAPGQGRGAAADDAGALSRLSPSVTSLLQSIRDWAPRVKTLGVPGLIGLEFERMDAAGKKQTLLHLERLLAEACRERPLVAAVDEAHTLDPEVARLLLNVAQNVSAAGAPFLLVLAGTPQLPRCLRRAERRNARNSQCRS